MTRDKILYVDDEAMALKYFERLVSPMAPVLTALSVNEGKEVLRTRGGEIAVLVSDQRMPGAHGNELLSYAREHHPPIVRMLTTAYSELGEAIEAINAGEIYRYITKPWDLESLRADLKNALELAELRGERDGLLQEKILVQQQQMLASRMSELAITCAGFVQPDYSRGLFSYLHSVLTTGCKAPVVDWNAMDHADLMQAEARRGIAIGQQLALWQAGLGKPGTFAEALDALAQALAGHARRDGDSLLILDRAAITWVLDGPTQSEPNPGNVAWLAWLIWWNKPVRLRSAKGGYEVFAPDTPVVPLPDDWLADCIEHIGREAISP
jgi:two-component system, probable response regulator PhcQ